MDSNYGCWRSTGHGLRRGRGYASESFHPSPASAVTLYYTPLSSISFGIAMSLDKNLFTLLFTPHKDNQHVIDLVDPSGTLYYRKQRVPGPEYKIEVYGWFIILTSCLVRAFTVYRGLDPMSESLLATATAPSPTNKVKTIELYNPTSVVEIKYTGTLSFRWSFKWEECVFSCSSPTNTNLYRIEMNSSGSAKSVT